MTLPPGLVGVSEVADMLGVKKGTVWNYTSRGTLPTPDYRIDGTPIWKVATIEAWQEVTHARRGMGRTDRPD